MPKTLADFKALLFDIDLTLTNSAREVTPRTRAALERLTQRNLKLSICSGRNFSVLKQNILPLFPVENIHITSGGGQLINGDGKVKWEKLIPDHICRTILQHATQWDMGAFHPYNGTMYVNDIGIERYQEKEHLQEVIQPINELPQWGAPVLVLTETDERIYTLLNQIPEISYKKGTSSINTEYADVTVKGITKAAGIMEWSKLTGIDPSEIIGFGDAENDLEFLQLVGHAVAMGNAQPQLKEFANKVIGHTDEDGLAVYLEKLLEGAPI